MPCANEATRKLLCKIAIDITWMSISCHLKFKRLAHIHRPHAPPIHRCGSSTQSRPQNSIDGSMQRYLRSVAFSSFGMPPSFNFSSYYLNESLSDATLLIRIDGNDVKQRLPGHAIVLANVSHVFRQEIEQQQGLGGRPAIYLDVQPDQVPAACAVVRFVYTGDLPEPTASQQPLLVHMLYLAHKFAVLECRAACYRVLMQCRDMQSAALGLAFLLLPPLLPDTVSAWHGPLQNAAATAAGAAGPSTPAHGASEPAAASDFGKLLHHCLNQLHQQLGDMEAVMRSPDQLAQLHSLPARALLALLHDERTSAASENTVLAAVHSWMGAAAQRDVRVDAEERQQLAAAVRVPLLEPCFLSTVLPRMGWLLEILGPQGLAAAAGVARGLCDPHAEPVLSNAHASGPLVAGWLQGPRPVPATCGRAMHGGPALVVNWTLPRMDVKLAFEAACADAAAKALGLQLQREAAATAAAETAAAHQQMLITGDAPAWGFRSPIAPATAAAAVSAVATAAAAAAARVFAKRKRSASVAESLDEGGRDQQSSSTAAVAQHAARHAGGRQLSVQHSLQLEALDEAGLDQQLQVLQPGSPHLVDCQDDAENPTQHIRKRRRRNASSMGEAATAAAGAAAAGIASTPKAGTAAASGGRVLPHTSPRAAGGLPRGGSSLGSEQQQHASRQYKLRSQETQFAGYSWRLVLYFQQREAAAADTAGAEADAMADCCEEGVLDTQQPAAAGLQVRSGRSTVAAAHAVSLPDDPRTGGPPVAGVPAVNCVWTARLAFEARPCVVLQPGVSTAAFSGSLAARLADGNAQDDGLLIRGAEAVPAPPSAGRAARRNSGVQQVSQRPGRGRATTAVAAGSQDFGPSPAGRLDRGDGSSPARYTGHAAAATCGPGLQGRHERSPASRHAAAGSAGVHKASQAHVGLLSIPESDDDEEEGSEGAAASSGPQDKARRLEDSEAGSDDDDDDGCMVVGEYNAATGYTGAAASTPKNSGCGRRQQQHTQRQTDGRAARRRLASDGGVTGALQQERATQGVSAAGDGVEDDSGWRMFQLPQGSWLKSRHCDTGFRNFFSITLQQDVWDEAAWQPYLQQGEVLQLRGEVWNVR